MKKILCNSCNLPIFSTMRFQQNTVEFIAALHQCYDVVEQIVITKSVINWNTLYQPLSFAENKLNCIWSVIKHLNLVKHEKDTFSSYETCLSLFTEYKIWLKQHRGLYDIYRKFLNNKVYFTLDMCQKKILYDFLLNCELSGINLSLNRQKIYRNIITRLSELGLIYNKNIFDSTISWTKNILNEQTLSGMPLYYLNSAKTLAKRHGKDGWLLTLQNSSYFPVMTYCDDRVLREELYLAYNARASSEESALGRWDNSPLVAEILSLRQESARLLGFKNYADKVLVTRVMQNAQQVICFLNNLFSYVIAKSRHEYFQLENFAKKYFHCNTIYPWDVLYFSEKQKEYLFEINDEIFFPYFPEDQVIIGMFEVVHSIYGITVKEYECVDVWHSDVRFFSVFDDFGKYRGSFYLDIYARTNKVDGAWMDEYTSMLLCNVNGIKQYPVAYLVCNFHRSCSNQQTSLMNHSEVVTLFHEFGHVLHHIMTNFNFPEISSVNSVPLDIVELSSQFMEYFCWHPSSLKLIASHYITADTIPDKLINKLLNMKKYRAASLMLHQLIYSLFDFRIHYELDENSTINFWDILTDIKSKTFQFSYIYWKCLPNVFQHIFSDDYAASYYGYLWSKVLAANIWYIFEHEKNFDQEIYQMFLDAVKLISRTEDIIDVFFIFFKNKPTLEIMLQYDEII